MKRYFISNYYKNKLVLDNLLGKPECIICKKNIVLDVHHVRFDKKIVFLCPNHHQMIHRIIFHAGSREEPFSLKQLMGRIKNIEKKCEKYCIEISKNQYVKSVESNIKSFPPIKEIKKGKIIYFTKEELEKRINEIQKDNVTRYFKYNYSGRIINEKKFFGKPKCLICGFSCIVDLHHSNKDEKTTFLCPNHHSILHRHLQDPNGDKYALKQAINKIKTIEKNNLPYYREITKQEYIKNFKSYQLTKIKTPFICHSCKEWFYPTNDRKSLCDHCQSEKYFRTLAK